MAEKIENLDNLVSTLKELNKSLEISARTLKQINNSKLALPVIKFADKLLCAVEECESAWRDICGKIEKRSQELVANIEGIFESLDNLEMGNSSNNNTSDDMETHLNTALAVFGFAGITLPDFLNGFTSAIKKLLAGGITLSDLLVSFGEFLISSPIGMEIGISILDNVEQWIRKNFGQRVVDAINASSTVAYAGAVGAWIGSLFGATPVGALVGLGVGSIVDWFYFDEYSSKIWDAIKKNLFNMDTTRSYFDLMQQYFDSIGDEDATLWIGWNIVGGILAGITGALASVVEPWADLFAWIWNGICDMFGINSPAEEMKPLGEYILLGIVQGFEDAFGAWTESIQKFWEEDVKPWFTLDNWTEVLSNIPEAFKVVFKNAANVAIEVFNKLINWINEKMYFSWDEFAFFDKIIIPAGSMQLFEIPNIPTFENGGFPSSASLFWANEYGVPELVGTVHGNAAVASSVEITGIADAVYSTGQSETSLLTEAVNLLRKIANKDMSFNIGDREIARANYRGRKALGSRLITEF